MEHGGDKEVVLEDCGGREFVEGFVAVAGKGTVEAGAGRDTTGEVGIKALN